MGNVVWAADFLSRLRPRREEEEAVPRVPGHLADVIARSCDLLDRTRDATAIADLLRARSA